MLINKTQKKKIQEIRKKLCTNKAVWFLTPEKHVIPCNSHLNFTNKLSSFTSKNFQNSSKQSNKRNIFRDATVWNSTNNYNSLSSRNLYNLSRSKSFPRILTSSILPEINITLTPQSHTFTLCLFVSRHLVVKCERIPISLMSRCRRLKRLYLHSCQERSPGEKDNPSQELITAYKENHESVESTAGLYVTCVQDNFGLMRENKIIKQCPEETPIFDGYSCRKMINCQELKGVHVARWHVEQMPSNSYMECIDGKLIHKTCKPGLIFDGEQCVSINNDGCAGRADQHKVKVTNHSFRVCKEGIASAQVYHCPESKPIFVVNELENGGECYSELCAEKARKTHLRKNGDYIHVYHFEKQSADKHKSLENVRIHYKCENGQAVIVNPNQDLIVSNKNGNSVNSNNISKLEVGKFISWLNWCYNTADGREARQCGLNPLEWFPLWPPWFSDLKHKSSIDKKQFKRAARKTKSKIFHKNNRNTNMSARLNNYLFHGKNVEKLTNVVIANQNSLSFWRIGCRYPLSYFANAFLEMEGNRLKFVPSCSKFIVLLRNERNLANNIPFAPSSRKYITQAKKCTYSETNSNAFDTETFNDYITPNYQRIKFRSEILQNKDDGVFDRNKTGNKQVKYQYYAKRSQFSSAIEKTKNAIVENKNRNNDNKYKGRTANSYSHTGFTDNEKTNGFDVYSSHSSNDILLRETMLPNIIFCGDEEFVFVKHGHNHFLAIKSQRGEIYTPNDNASTDTKDNCRDITAVKVGFPIPAEAQLFACNKTTWSSYYPVVDSDYTGNKYASERFMLMITSANASTYFMLNHLQLSTICSAVRTVERTKGHGYRTFIYTKQQKDYICDCDSYCNSRDHKSVKFVSFIKKKFDKISWYSETIKISSKEYFHSFLPCKVSDSRLRNSFRFAGMRFASFHRVNEAAYMEDLHSNSTVTSIICDDIGDIRGYPFRPDIFLTDDATSQTITQRKSTTFMTSYSGCKIRVTNIAALTGKRLAVFGVSHHEILQEQMLQYFVFLPLGFAELSCIPRNKRVCLPHLPLCVLVDNDGYVSMNPNNGMSTNSSRGERKNCVSNGGLWDYETDTCIENIDGNMRYEITDCISKGFFDI